MAMIKCKNCSKDISDIYDNCPYCKTEVHSKNSPSHSDYSSDDLKTNLIQLASAAVFTYIALFVMQIISVNNVSYYLGSMFTAGIASVMNAFSLLSVIMLGVSAVCFLILRLILKNFTSLPDFVTYIISTAIITVLWSVVMFIFRFPLISLLGIPMSVFAIGINVPYIYALAIPLLMGGMLIFASNVKPVIGIVLELVSAVLFVVLYFLLIFPAVFTFALGVGGLIISAALASALTLIIAVIKEIVLLIKNR